MAKIEKFEDLQCWQLARALTKEIFELDGPLTTNWGLRDQLQRAALSSMNNIAEGFSRFSDREKIRFFEIAQSSANEVKSMIYILEDLNYVTPEKSRHLFELTNSVRSKILAFIKYLNSKK